MRRLSSHRLDATPAPQLFDDCLKLWVELFCVALARIYVVKWFVHFETHDVSPSGLKPRWGIYGSQIRKGEFDLGNSLFGLPFLIGTIVLCTLILFGLFGRWEITVHRGEGMCFVGIAPFGWRRRFQVGPNARVSLEMSSYRVNEQPQEAITVQENGRKIISFGAPITSREPKVFIAAAMTNALA